MFSIISSGDFMKKNKNILFYAGEMVKENHRINCEGPIFKIIKLLYIIAALYCIMVCLAMMIGCAFTMSEYSAKETTDAVSKFNESETQFWSMVISVVSAVGCLVLLKFKASIPFAVIGCVNCFVSFALFYGASVKNDIVNGGQGIFWGTFGVPSIVLAVLSLLIGTLMFIDNYRIKSAYNAFTAELYSKYSENGTKALSAEAFEEIMNNYKGEEVFRTDIPLKKSLRRRKEKQDELMSGLENSETKDEE